MSYWTYIVGVIHVDTYEEVDDIRAYVQDALKNAPEITGSEGPASVFVNAESEYNVSTDFDCARYLYKDTLQTDCLGFSCDSPEDFHCPYGEYQTCAVITVCGSLRDRFKKQTRKERNEFHRYIAKTLGWSVRIATCRIDGY